MPDTILISGGASGIGRHIAEGFLAAGATVHICDASADALNDFLGANTRATGTQADVSIAEQVDRVYAEFASTHDKLDVLVNNAGIAGPTAAVEDVADDEWDRCIAVNLSGSFYMTRRAVPLLKRHAAGCIINISSVAGLFGCPLRSPYAAGKWALIGLTRTWAMELGPYNVRVNAICPTSVEGERIDGVIERDAAARGVSAADVRQTYERQSSMRSFVSPRDITEMVLFLASERAAKISGQAISVDGHTETLGYI